MMCGNLRGNEQREQDSGLSQPRCTGCEVENAHRSHTRNVGGAGGASASVLSSLGLMGTEGTERRRLGGDLNSSCAGVNPTEQLRAHFVQECMLSALSYSGDPDEQSGGDPQ